MREDIKIEFLCFLECVRKTQHNNDFLTRSVINDVIIGHGARLSRRSSSLMGEGNGVR